MGWEEAETFRLSSFAAATELNELQCFKLERSQPHNLVTCQPCHVAIVAAIGRKLSDRATRIENQLPKEGEESSCKVYRILVKRGDLFFVCYGEGSPPLLRPESPGFSYYDLPGPTLALY